MLNTAADAIKSFFENVEAITFSACAFPVSLAAILSLPFYFSGFTSSLVYITSAVGVLASQPLRL